MKTLEVDVLIPVYGVKPIPPDYYWSFRRWLKSALGNLRIDDIYVIEFRERFTKVKIAGPDAETAVAFLRRTYGVRLNTSDIREGEVFAGRVYALADDHILVDIGVGEDQPELLVRVPLTEFARALGAKEMDRETFMLLGIRERFPLQVKIGHIEGTTAEGTLGERTVRLLQRWLERPVDRIIVYGATRAQVERAIKKAGHTRDVVNVERLGFLEHAIVCKRGTSAKGLIPRLGPFLWGVKLEACRIQEVARRLGIKVSRRRAL